MDARDTIRLAVGSALGLGLAPVAPGSFGALLGVVIHVVAFFSLSRAMLPWALLGALIATILANHVLTPWAVDYWREKDPSHFVLDEVAGYLMVPLLYPYGPLWHTAVVGFLLFRVIDIIKVPPARQIDRQLSGPWGIVLDDLVSGAYAAMLLHAYRLLI
ncbi:MAG TPA: phosphatidylglycerophosphatase A [Vicinamibacteria bacterium]|nr:phosphatidylglycerophosphatase A [Vicinamibacteria bacterium]